MEDRYQHTLNGQSVVQADLNVLGETSALADDRVFAELFRMEPFDGSTVRKGILPYAHRASGAGALIEPTGALGGVLVNPFRAFVGSRTAAENDGKKNWRDIRSTLSVAEIELQQVVTFTANASGNPRWDLVYAAVAVDANTASVPRKLKSPTTKVVSAASVVTRLATTVTLGVQAGTASATPVWPAVPSDAGDVYYIPLSYVRVPNGFNATSTVLPEDIADVAPCLAMSHATGVAAAEPANQQYAVSTTRQQAWGASGGKRPTTFIPPTLTGLHTLFIALDLSDATLGFHSHIDGAVLDTRDWRGRLCFWQACVSSGSVSSGGFPWDDDMPATPGMGTIFKGESMFPDEIAVSGSKGSPFWVGAGQTITKTFHELFPDASLIARLDDEQSDFMEDEIAIVCDHASGGVLRLYKPGNPRCRLFFRLDFTAPYSNKLI